MGHPTSDTLKQGWRAPLSISAQPSGQKLCLTVVVLIGIPALIMEDFSPVAWIGARQKCKNQTRGRFAIVLIFTGLGTLIYALAKPCGATLQ